MLLRAALFPAALAVLLNSCVEPSVNTETARDGLSPGVAVLLKGHEGGFVACELGAEGDDKGTLVANRPEAGDWERFTLFTKPDGRIALQAANGKYICSDGDRGGLLIANRDYIGEWETFVLIPKDNGRVALRTYNGSFVAADYNLVDQQRGRLIGDRKEVGDWELFTIMPDTTQTP